MQTGIHQRTLKLEGGTELRYTISIPSSYGAESTAPLIVALHYGGPVTPFYGRGVLEALVQPALAQLNAVIVAPDSLNGPWTNEVNEKAVLQLMDFVLEEYSINPQQTLLTGFSRGGEGTWYIGGRNQDRFAAAIPIAGRTDDDREWKIPVYAIHSTVDEVVPFAPVQQHIEQLQSQGASIILKAVDGIPHYETPQFTTPLRDAIPWIKRAWNASANS